MIAHDRNMHLYSKIAKICSSRGIRKVFYFHTDHFEPWGRNVNELTIGRLAEFARQSSILPYAQRLTLFYLPHVNYKINSDQNAEDLIQFIPRTQAEQKEVMGAIDLVKQAANHSFELHLHHEQFTFNESDYGEPHSSIKLKTTPERDFERVSRLIDMGKRYFEADTGLSLNSWGFIHGNWALNGSDLGICQIKDEIDLLLKKNSWGDFTFPAGRSHCDPDIKWPHTVVPCSELKGYVHQEAQPRLIGKDPQAFDSSRFFIWSSEVPYASSSLDYYSQMTVARLKEWELFLLDWFMLAPVIEGTLLIKTHAHSMADHYYEGESPCIPHAHPDVRKLFTHLHASCSLAGIGIQYGSVAELRALLELADQNVKPAVPASTSTSNKPAQESPDAILKRSKNLLETTAIRLVNELASENPPLRNSLGSYYLERLTIDHLVTTRDQDILRYCINHLDDAILFEIGSGIGELPILAGMSGIAAVGIESDQSRFTVATALAEAIAIGSFGGYSQPRFIDGEFPQALPEELLFQTPQRRMVACLSNISSSYIVKHEQRTLRTLWLFDDLIIDFAKFAKARTSDEQEALLDMLMKRFTLAATITKNPDSNLVHLTSKMKPVISAVPIVASTTTTQQVMQHSAISAWSENCRLLACPARQLPVTDVFPRLALRKERVMKLLEAGLDMEITNLITNEKSIQKLTQNSSWIKFELPGLYQLSSPLGKANVASLSSAEFLEEDVLRIAAMVSTRVRHSCGHEWLLRPDLHDTPYRDFSTMLTQLFYGELPLQLQCDNAADMACMILDGIGFRTRLVSIRSQHEGGGHFVMEVYLPDKPGWVMLDCDFGIAVRGSSGKLLSVEEIGALRDYAACEYVQLSRKHWLSDAFNFEDHYTGLAAVDFSDESTSPTISSRSYEKIMANHFHHPAYYEHLGQHENRRICAFTADIAHRVITGTKDEINKEIDLMLRTLSSFYSVYVSAAGHEMGDTQNYSLRKMEDRAFLTDEELDLLRYVIRHWNQSRPVFVIGGDFGQISLALGWFGYRCYVVDPALAEKSDLWFLLDRIDKSKISTAHKFVSPIPVACSFPTDLPDTLWEEASSGLLICLNFSSGTDTKGLWQSLEKFDEVIFCPGRFGVEHDDVFEQENVLASVTRYLNKRNHLLSRHHNLGYWRLY